jgi:hypothetical protein
MVDPSLSATSAVSTDHFYPVPTLLSSPGPAHLTSLSFPSLRYLVVSKSLDPAGRVYYLRDNNNN